MKTVIIISANAEWRSVKEILSPADIESTPVGETFNLSLERGTGQQKVCFFHGGWGKISAATTTQYIIDRFQPELLVNLGTCGGFEGRVERGTILLVERTIVYDILEQMGNADEAVTHYATDLDLSWLAEKVPGVDARTPPVQRGLLVSADRDIFPGDIPMLVEKYGAVAADWESGAIAWVAKRNGIRCLILRGVTDLVSAGGGEAYNNIGLFHEATKRIMRTLLEQLPDWLENIA